MLAPMMILVAERTSAPVERHRNRLTNVAPDGHDDDRVVGPYDGVDAINNVSGEQPGNHGQRSHIARPPMPWEGDENEDSCQQRDVREFRMYHDT